MILEEIKNIKSTKKDLKSFGLTVGIVLVIIGAMLYYFQKQSYPYFISVGFLLIIFGIIFPKILLPLQKIWMGISVILGWISTRIILSVLFYFVITPIKLVSKLAGKKFLNLEIRKEQKSYWEYRTKKEYIPQDSEKQF